MVIKGSFFFFLHKIGIVRCQKGVAPLGIRSLASWVAGVNSQSAALQVRSFRGIRVTEAFYRNILFFF